MVVPYSLTHATLLASIKRFALACAAGLASCWIVNPVLFHQAIAQDKSIGPSADQLGAHLDPWLAALQLKTEQFSLKALGDVRIDNKPQSVDRSNTGVNGCGFAQASQGVLGSRDCRC
jgi:uncharacterized protein with beta-barrel porin domain